MAVPRAGDDKETGKAGRRGFNWYQLLFGPAFVLIGFFYRAYRRNRDRVARLTTMGWASALFSKAVVLTLIVWIAVWLLASEESRSRLTEAVKRNLSSIESSFRN